MPKLVRLEKLQPFLDAFRPDVVMCVAGGITFREDEYRDIMERCVTVGITVSDPEAYYLAREIATRDGRMVGAGLEEAHALPAGSVIGIIPLAFDLQAMLVQPPAAVAIG